MPGPRPTPTAILRARGSWRAAAREKTEPHVESSRPPAPKWLRVGAHQYYHSLLERVCAARTMTHLDAEALATLAHCLWVAEKCQAIIDREGLIAERNDGTIYEHPAMRMQGAAMDRACRLYREFGLTPSARSSIKTAPKEEHEKKETERFIRLG